MRLRTFLSSLRPPLERLIKAQTLPPQEATALTPDALPQQVRTLQRRTRLLRQDEITQVVTRYQAGATMVELARELDVHRGTIRACLVAQGVVLRSGSSFPTERLQEAVSLYEAGLSTARVAAELGLTQRVVWRALRDAGVVMRDRTGS
ncbi:hypothetical protein [Kineococcus glutinatus]|uniref:Homeodomain-like domain-containing protein n=1 Tax=Kineococcus glutinatus TaxID=1070872 RepID=A0ABP9HPZ9_9ACTN